jgi:fatty acid desaturase
MRASSVAGGLGFTGLFGVLGNAVGMPWWVLLAIAVLIIVSVTVVSVVQQLMPQDSHHKLQLWTAMIRQRGRRAEITPGDRMPPANR